MPQEMRRQWHLRFDRGLRRLLRNKLEARRFLATEVYDVPEDLLDDVVRVTLAELSGSTGG
jgi:hypothetical protein